MEISGLHSNAKEILLSHSKKIDLLAAFVSLLLDIWYLASRTPDSSVSPPTSPDTPQFPLLVPPFLPDLLLRSGVPQGSGLRPLLQRHTLSPVSSPSLMLSNSISVSTVSKSIISQTSLSNIRPIWSIAHLSSPLRVLNSSQT